jgi:O-antigen ligase
LRASTKGRVFVVVSGLLLLVAAYSASPVMQERVGRFSMVFSNPEELRVNESAFLRHWFIVRGLEVARNHPLFGVGVDNARLVLIPPGMTEGMYSHNNYVEMLLNAGLIGFLFHYLPIVFIYFSIKKNNNQFFVQLKTFIVLYLVYGVAMVQYNVFNSVFLYSLIIFLYYYGKKEDVPFALHCQHSETCGTNKSTAEFN